VAGHKRTLEYKEWEIIGFNMDTVVMSQHGRNFSSCCGGKLMFQIYESVSKKIDIIRELHQTGFVCPLYIRVGCIH